MTRNTSFRQAVRIVPLSLLSLAGAACATSSASRAHEAEAPRPSVSPTTSASPTAVRGELSGPERSDYREITTLFNRGAYDSAIQRLIAFKNRYPRSAQTPQIENLTGLAYLMTKRPQQAIPFFRRAIELNPGQDTYNQYIAYNLAKAQFEANQAEEAQKTLATIKSEVMDHDNRLKTHYLKARTAAQLSHPADAARELLAAGKWVGTLSEKESQEARTTLMPLLEQSLQQLPEPSVLDEIYRANQDSAFADAALLQLGSRRMSLGDTAQGETDLKQLLSKFPQSPYTADANALLHQQERQGKVDSAAVGVLLPMKGKFAKFGTRSLQAIGLALGMFHAGDADSKITLFVEDSGEDAAQAIRALTRLVEKHHVVAVIGPLLSKGIDQVSDKARELGVPLLSLARYSRNANEYVFPSGLTLKLQAQEMARYALQTLGIKKFAIVYPFDKVGEEISQAFWDAVEAGGGEVTGFESYQPNETDFRAAVDRLSGLHYTEARARELEELAKLRDENQIKKRTRRTEKYFALPPIVDYEAVFIPDEPKVAGQVLPTFAYRDVDHVRFLGTSAWNSPELTARAQTYAEKAVFVDAFFPESQSPLTRRFVEKYRATFAQEPNGMDAIAYDAANLLESVLSGNVTSRSEVRDRLKEVRKFSGVTGKISYQDGQFTRDLKILTVKNGKVVEASK